MTKDTYAAIKKLVDERKDNGTHDATAAVVEKFCASKQVEYHPLACDLVEAAYTPKKELDDPSKGPRKCVHVSTTTRDAADEWLAAPEPEPKAEPAAKKK
jgi:hypothetical protein